MLQMVDNERLCRVGPGTPGGELFRSVWLPALLSSQLPDPGCSPVRLRLLGEDLIGYRDGSGRVGIVQSTCAHRLAPLYFGRVEEKGIRCAYHGWLYDATGQCLEMMNEPNKAICAKVKITAYKTIEKADIIWIYMGGGEPPALPQFPWMDLPTTRRNASVWLQESNWLQGAEGEIDSSHVSILHSNQNSLTTTAVHREWSALDTAPKLFIRETPIGFLSIARRNAKDKFYWRVTQWMLPMFSSVPSYDFPIGGRAYVPIDDENTYNWDFNYDLDRDFSEEFQHFVDQWLGFPPESTYRSFRLNTGTTIDSYIPIRRADNDYLIDREMQRNVNMSGLHGLNDQDRCMQEGMSRIVNRALEFLVAADRSIITARRRILDAIASPDSLSAFKQSVRDGRAFAVRPLDVVSDISDVAVLFEHFKDEMRVN
jgi:phenylpropionate dioxygenase-like ring-hydroxylating dioxygenase large terminal subunit